MKQAVVWAGGKRVADLAPGLRKIGREGVRYGIVSVGALACDLVVYAAVVQVGVLPAAAGALGYVIGLLVHYTLSSCWVFPDPGERRTVPTLAKFVATGLLGLMLTTAIIGILTTLGLATPFLAKAIAVGSSGLAVFLLRRAYVFAAAPCGWLRPAEATTAAARTHPRP